MRYDEDILHQRVMNSVLAELIAERHGCTLGEVIARSVILGRRFEHVKDVKRSIRDFRKRPKVRQPTTSGASLEPSLQLAIALIALSIGVALVVAGVSDDLLIR
jgi:hypothetical protein